MAEKNKELNPDFLSLSSEQMHRVLHRPFEDTDDIVALNLEISSQDFAEVPVVAEAQYILKRLNDPQSLKATAKGNLPRAFVREVHTKFPGVHDLPGSKIMSENDDTKLMALRRMLATCAWLKKRHNRYSLTRKGQDLVDKGFEVKEYLQLLKSYMFKFNWGFRDRYPELAILQQSVLFCCYLLHKRAGELIHTDELGDCFLRAYPAVMDTVDGISSVRSPEEVVRAAFALRFIERFCEYFGMLSIRRKPKKLYLQDRFVETTPLFKKLFCWKL